MIFVIREFWEASEMYTLCERLWPLNDARYLQCIISTNDGCILINILSSSLVVAYLLMYLFTYAWL